MTNAGGSVSEESNVSHEVESQASQHGQTMLNIVYAGLEESQLPIVELDLTADTLTVEFEDGSKREIALADPWIPAGGLNPAVPPTPGDPAQQGASAT